MIYQCLKSIKHNFIIDKGIESLNKKATYVVDSISDCLQIIDKK